MTTKDLRKIAAHQLNVPVEQVPEDYIRQLHRYPNASAEDANFRAVLRGGDGFGIVHCNACNTSVKLGKDVTRVDCGLSTGIGSLEEFTKHCNGPDHKARVSLSYRSSGSSSHRNGNGAHTGQRHEVDANKGVLKTSTAAPRVLHADPALSRTSRLLPTWSSTNYKRLSEAALGEQTARSNKRPRLEVESGSEAHTTSQGPVASPDIGAGGTDMRAESPELGSPPRRSHNPTSAVHLTSLPVKPLQVFDRSLASSTFPLAHTPTITQAYPTGVTPAWSSSDAGTGSASLSAMTAVTNSVPPPVETVTSNALSVVGASARGDSKGGLDVWIQNAATADVFEENITVQSCMQKLGLTQQGRKFPGMEISLLPHQIMGVAWMREQETSQSIGHFGGILADEMGLGKTVQMIATMCINRPPNGKPKGTLIVCPLALLDQWKDEIETKTTGLWTYVYHGPSRAKNHRHLQRYDVVLTTYPTLSLDLPTSYELKKDELPDDGVREAHKLGPLLRTQWYRVVLDEAQIIRSAKSRASSAAARLQSTLRWCLTGTPIVNSLSDAFPLLRVLRIRPWYDWQHFNSMIVKNEQKHASLCGKRLQGIFKSCLLRRTKNSTLDGRRLIELPEKKIDTVIMEFSQEEREIYEMMQKRAQSVINRFLREGTVLKNHSHVLTLLMRLRQCACHPALIQEDYDEATLEALDEERRQEELERAAKLVSSSFVDEAELHFLNIAKKRVQLEKASLNNVLEDDCPICDDIVDEGVFPCCLHVFCHACVQKLFEKPMEEGAKSSSKERPCPKCGVPFKKELVFLRSAFEPSDRDLAQHAGNSLGPVERWPIQNDDQQEGRAKPQTRDRGRFVGGVEIPDLQTDSESETSIDDFIVGSDEDEEEKDRKKAAKKNRKARHGKIRRTLSSTWGSSGTIKKPMAGSRRFLPSTKMKAMMKKLKSWKREYPDDKTLVISQFVGALDVVAGYLQEQRFEFVRYQGDMTKAARESAVKEFMKSGGPTVMLMSLKAGGMGLNLTRANRVISLDLGWSEAVEAQAFDRVHRLGQTKEVLVQRLVISNTVEERILALHERKRGLADQSLGEGSGKKLTKMSVNDMLDLFGMS